MADIAIAAPAVALTPSAYVVKGSDEIILKSARVHYDGSAAGAYVPVLQLIDPGGVIVAECELKQTIAAAGSADITWFHGVSAAAAGGGSDLLDVLFNTDNVNTYLQIEETGFVAADFTQSNAMGGNHATSYSEAINAADGMVITATPGNNFNNGNAVLTLLHSFTTGNLGAFGLQVVAADTTAAGTQATTGVSVNATGRSSSLTEGVTVFATNAGSADSIAVGGTGDNTGTGREIGGLFQAGGHQTGAKSLALLCEDHSTNPIFEVRDDGSVHIKTGTSIVADL